MLRPFDAYEIAPVTSDEDGDCMPHLTLQEAEEQLEYPGTNATVFWTLYGHHPSGGVSAIGDFDSYESAAEMYYFITGCEAPDNEEMEALHALPPAPGVDNYPWGGD
jgi:hypothetical protein